ALLARGEGRVAEDAARRVRAGPAGAAGERALPGGVVVADGLRHIYRPGIEIEHHGGLDLVGVRPARLLGDRALDRGEDGEEVGEAPVVVEPEVRAVLLCRGADRQDDDRLRRERALGLDPGQLLEPHAGHGRASYPILTGGAVPADDGP